VYAEVGDFAAAVKWQKEAIDLLTEDKRAKWQANYKSRLKLHQSGKRYDKGNLWSFSTGQMIGWWKFEEAKGGVTVDSSGNDLDGKLVGGAHIISDPVRGNVLSLDGDGDYVDCGKDSAFDITDEITVEGWIKVNMFDKTWQAIVAKGDSSWRLHRHMEWDSVVFAFSPWPGTHVWTSGDISVNDGQWHHVVGVYDGTKTYQYVDGRLDVSAEATGRINTNSWEVLIGENAEQPGREWNGLMDDVRIYSYALSEAEIKALYAGKGPGPTEH